jgi:hypothetical protein
MLYEKYKVLSPHLLPTACRALAPSTYPRRPALQDEDDDNVGVDGLVRLCEDLDVDPSDLRMLLLCHALRVRLAPLRPAPPRYHGTRRVQLVRGEGRGVSN